MTILIVCLARQTIAIVIFFALLDNNYLHYQRNFSRTTDTTSVVIYVVSSMTSTSFREYVYLMVKAPLDLYLSLYLLDPYDSPSFSSLYYLELTWLSCFIKRIEHTPRSWGERSKDRCMTEETSSRWRRGRESNHSRKISFKSWSVYLRYSSNSEIIIMMINMFMFNIPCSSVGLIEGLAASFQQLHPSPNNLKTNFVFFSTLIHNANYIVCTFNLRSWCIDNSTIYA